MKTGYKEPKALEGLSKQIQALSGLAREMGRKRRDIVKAHKNIADLRLRAYAEGIPGSNEPFNTPVLALEDEIDRTIRHMQAMKAACQQLLYTDPENWA